MTAIRYPRPGSLPAADARFVVVEASAGTGKTFFLEHRVVDLIVAGARLDEILVVTFTDKAVAELRLRVRDLIDRISRATVSSDAPSCWEIDDDVRVRLRASVNAFDRAPIYTIHGFCHRVLVEDAFAAHRPLHQDQIADEVAFDSAFGALLSERFAKDEPERSLLAAFLERDKTVDQLRDLLLACSRATTSPPRAYDPDAVAALGARLRATFADPEALERTLPMRGQDPRHVPGWLVEIRDALAGSELDPARVLAACDAVRKRTDSLADKALKWAGQESFAKLMREASGVMKLEEAVASRMLPAIVERAGADKASRGQYDYDDMLRLVHEALRGERGGGLAARLRERTPWVLIDEFQDTDPTQWQIFREVWLAEGGRGLAIVGDPKQAIYGFRGADVDTYVAAREELKRLGAESVVLDVNRRSTTPLVEAVNAILLPPLAPLFSKSNEYVAVKSSGDVASDDPRPPIAVFALNGAGPNENRAALADAIGAEIERLRDAAPTWRCRGQARAFSLAQVMVLTRANKESVAIAAALRSRGLACELRESDKLFDTREAHELAAVLAAIAAPRDRSSRMRALRTRFFDVPWAELMRVVDAPDHHPAIARVHEWAALASRRAYEPLFRRLLEDSRYAERTLVLGSGERALVNTWHLIELLLEEVARSRCDLHELVVVLRRWISDEADQPGERDVQRVETDADAVRVLTIHKAKGLEAPYVFVFGANGKAPPKRVPWREVDEAAENERLAYVALTRAQLRLYLPRYGDKALDGGSAYVPIQRCLAPAIAGAPHLFETIEVAVPPPEIPDAPPNALAGVDVPAPPAVAELAALPPARAGLAMLSYTRLARELDAAQIELREAVGDVRSDDVASPRAEAPAAVERAELDADVPGGVVGEGELPPGIDSGLFLHDLFEHVDLAGVRAARDAAAWADEPAVKQLLAEHARERGVAKAYLPHAARVVYSTLTQPLALAGADPLPPLASARALAREVEFAYPIPGAPDRGLVKGFIDALVVFDDDLWVLDYKSDVLADPSAARAHVDAHYALQARLYAIAADRVRGARRLSGLLFAFVRHGVTVAVRAPDDKLAAWTAWLGRQPEVSP